MNIKITIDDDSQLEIAFSGKLDTIGAGEVDTKVYAMLNSIQKPVYFDFSEVTYLSSMGLRLIISSIKMVKKADHSLLIINANEEVQHVLEMTNLDKLNF